MSAKAVSHLAQIKRFYEVIGAADLGSDLAVFRRVASGAEHYGEGGQVWAALDGTTEIEARTIGQVHIKQNQIRRGSPDETEHRSRVGSGSSFVAEAAEKGTE